MNAFTANMAKELTKISRNNHSAIVNYIMYYAYIDKMNWEDIE